MEFLPFSLAALPFWCRIFNCNWGTDQMLPGSETKDFQVRFLDQELYVLEMSSSARSCEAARKYHNPKVQSRRGL
jgi:hypothetical protein